MNVILDEIIKNSDTAYKAFQEKLIPTICKESVLGLRAPLAQKIAKKYAQTSEGEDFLSSLPHKYYDQNIVHAFMLGLLKRPRAELRQLIIDFLPFVDNWAVCDGLVSHLKHFFEDKDGEIPFVLSCLKSNHTYTVRFGLVCLLSYYITDEYIDILIDIVTTIKSDEYYINMALAWLVSFMLIKQYKKTVHLIENGCLDAWVNNKSIQKACESYQISSEQKTYLKRFKRK
jgi:3-methyladenine DNA glycosylase AlkD